MVTTIQVTEHTLALLKKVRHLMGTKTYNEAIDQLLHKELAPARSLYGAFRRPGRKYPMKVILKDLRDESDRKL